MNIFFVIIVQTFHKHKINIFKNIIEKTTQQVNIKKNKNMFCFP